MPRELVVSCHGARVLIVDGAGSGVCERLKQSLPGAASVDHDGAADACFVVEKPAPADRESASAYRVSARGEVRLSAPGIDEVLEWLRREIDLAVALHSRSGTFVHAGVVGWRGRALVVPGRPGCGKSRLVAELVRRGAIYYSDAFAVFDDDGRVEAYVRAPVFRGALPFSWPPAGAKLDGGEPLPVALVAATTYLPGASWQPAVVRGARAVLPIIDNAVLSRREPGRVLRLAATIAPTVVTLRGLRPDAAIAAPRILEILDDVIDGRQPAREGLRLDAAVLERAQARLMDVRSAREGAADTGGRGSPDEIERALLATQEFILLLHWHGRFGNRMHQYAYGVTYARLNACKFWLPSDWEGTRLFRTQHHEIVPDPGLRARLTQSQPRGETPEHRFAEARRLFPQITVVQPNDPRQNYRKPEGPACFDSVCAYHPSIFSAMSRRHLLSVFEFSDEVRALGVYKRLEDRQGRYDIAHLRRDDISNSTYNQTHPQGYSVLSKDAYFTAFRKYGCDPAAIEWVSDDHTGKWLAKRAPVVRGGWRYPTGSEYLPGMIFDWLEDFLKLYFARTIFRANSSFSWWAAFLSPCARVFSPVVDKRHVYGVDGLEEVELEFVEGNHPHWMFNNADIVMGA